VLLTATLPVIELRGAIPLGLSLGLSLGESVVLSLAGNLAPIPLAFKLLQPIILRLHRIPPLRRMTGWLLRRSSARAEAVKRYGWMGLVLLVAVPLPSTGAWTGVLVASLLRLRFWPAMSALALGTALAAFIVALLTWLGHPAI